MQDQDAENSEWQYVPQNAWIGTSRSLVFSVKALRTGGGFAYRARQPLGDARRKPLYFAPMMPTRKLLSWYAGLRYIQQHFVQRVRFFRRRRARSYVRPRLTSYSVSTALLENTYRLVATKMARNLRRRVLQQIHGGSLANFDNLINSTLSYPMIKPSRLGPLINSVASQDNAHRRHSATAPVPIDPALMSSVFDMIRRPPQPENAPNDRGPLFLPHIRAATTDPATLGVLGSKMPALPSIHKINAPVSQRQPVADRLSRSDSVYGSPTRERRVSVAAAVIDRRPTYHLGTAQFKLPKSAEQRKYNPYVGRKGKHKRSRMPFEIINAALNNEDPTKGSNKELLMLGVADRKGANEGDDGNYRVKKMQNGGDESDGAPKESTEAKPDGSQLKLHDRYGLKNVVDTSAFDALKVGEPVQPVPRKAIRNAVKSAFREFSAEAQRSLSDWIEMQIVSRLQTPLPANASLVGNADSDDLDDDSVFPRLIDPEEVTSVLPHANFAVEERAQNEINEVARNIDALDLAIDNNPNATRRVLEYIGDKYDEMTAMTDQSASLIPLDDLLYNTELNASEFNVQQVTNASDYDVTLDGISQMEIRRHGKSRSQAVEPIQLLVPPRKPLPRPQVQENPPPPPPPPPPVKTKAKKKSKKPKRTKKPPRKLVTEVVIPEPEPEKTFQLEEPPPLAEPEPVVEQEFIRMADPEPEPEPAPPVVIESPVKEPKPEVKKTIKLPPVRTKQRTMRQQQIKMMAAMEGGEGLDLLSKYCIIHQDRLPLYEKIFMEAYEVQRCRLFPLLDKYHLVPPPPDMLTEESLNMQKFTPDGALETQASSVESVNNEAAGRDEKPPEATSHSAHRLTAENTFESEMSIDVMRLEHIIDASRRERLRSTLNFMENTHLARNSELLRPGEALGEAELHKWKDVRKALVAKRVEADNLTRILSERQKLATLEVLQKAFPSDFETSLLIAGGAKKLVKSKAALSSKRKNQQESILQQVEEKLRFLNQNDVLLKLYPKILENFPKKMIAKLDEVPRLIQLKTEFELTSQRAVNLRTIITQVESEVDVLERFVLSDYFSKQKAPNPDERSRKQSIVYRVIHPEKDVEINYEELNECLYKVNSQLTPQEKHYIFSVLDIPSQRRINLRLFSIVAALSERVANIDTFTRQLINKMSMNALDAKMAKCRDFFWKVLLSMIDQEDDYDVPPNKLRVSRLAVEFKAGGVQDAEIAHVISKLDRHNTGLIDFLDIVCYIPLFIMLHERVVDDPLYAQFKL